MPKKQTEVSDKRGRGKPRRYGAEVCKVRGFALPPSMLDRLAAAADQTGHSQSAIVVAGLRQILAQSPDRLRDAVDGSR